MPVIERSLYVDGGGGLTHDRGTELAYPAATLVSAELHEQLQSATAQKNELHRDTAETTREAREDA